MELICAGTVQFLILAPEKRKRREEYQQEQGRFIYSETRKSGDTLELILQVGTKHC
jgi:hypothetical protein